MERDLVGFGRAIAAALLGPDVDDDRALEVEHALEGLEERVEIVAGHDPDVGDPEILEELARRGEIHH